MTRGTHGSLVIFLPFSGSFEKYRQMGILEREIVPFIHFSHFFSRTVIISYGRNEQAELKLMPQAGGLPNLRIKVNFLKLPVKLYHFLIPFLFFRTLARSDIFFVDQMTGAFPASIAAGIFRKKMIVRCGYELLSFLEKQKATKQRFLFFLFVESCAYYFAKIIIITSEEARLFIQKKFRWIDQNKIVVITNWIDIDLFHPKKIKKRIINNVISVGRLEEQKNFCALIDACAIYAVSLTIVGAGQLEAKLYHHASSKNVNLTIIPSVSNHKLPDILNQFRCFILPSIYEGCPKALLEAMACGLVVIGTRVEGISSLITDKKNGILCEDDSKSIANAIHYVMSHPEEHELLGMNAIKNIYQFHSLESYLGKLREIFISLTRK